MTDRQKALLAYLYTIKPHLAGARTTEDFATRVAKCLRDDLAFTAVGFMEAAVGVLEQRAAGFVTNVLSDAGKNAGAFFASLRKKQ